MYGSNSLYIRDEDPLPLFLDFQTQLVGTLRSRLGALQTRVNAVTLPLLDKKKG